MFTCHKARSTAPATLLNIHKWKTRANPDCPLPQSFSKQTDLKHRHREKQLPSPPADISVGITDSRNKNLAGNSAAGSGSYLLP